MESQTLQGIIQRVMEDAKRQQHVEGISFEVMMNSRNNPDDVYVTGVIRFQGNHRASYVLPNVWLQPLLSMDEAVAEARLQALLAGTIRALWGLFS